MLECQGRRYQLVGNASINKLTRHQQDKTKTLVGSNANNALNTGPLKRNDKMIVQTNEEQPLVTETETSKYINIYIETVTNTNNDSVSYKYEQVEIDKSMCEEAIVITVDKVKKRLDKEASLLALDTIVIEVNGKVFDGNEKARLNMLSALQAAQVTDMESTYWKLADNTVAEVTVDEMKEALTKAIQAVGNIIV